MLKRLILALCFALLLSGNLRAQTYISGGSGSTGGATCTDSTFTAVLNDTIVAAFSTTNGAGGVTPAITDSLGNATGSAFYKGEDSGNHATLTVWIYKVTVAGTDTVSHTDGQGTTYWKSCAVAQYLNSLSVDLSAPASNINTNSWASGTTTTTNHAVEVLVGIMSADQGFTWTQGTLYTARQTGDTTQTSTFIEDQNVVSTGTYQATATTVQATPAGNGIGQIITLYLSGGTNYNATPSETNTTSDVLGRLAGFARADSESNTASDALARQVSFGRGDTESNPASDLVSRLATFGRAGSETNTASDAIASGLSCSCTLAESSTVSDSLARAASFGRGDSESNATSDTISRLSVFDRGETESNTAVDVLARLAGFGRSNSESNPASDAIARIAVYLRGSAETNVAADHVLVLWPESPLPPTSIMAIPH